jgi:pimeloyl-ACP methyl ester carboxylesterase
LTARGMAKFVSGMNQPLDGYVDHMAFAPSPGLFRLTRMPTIFLWVVSSVTSPLIQAALPAVPAARVAPCKLPGVVETTRCGSIEVPENPDKPAGRRIQIGFAVVPTTGGRAAADPIAVLMGGPSEDAISMAPDFAKMFAALRSDRDLLLVDQRGTGRSNALTCNMYEESETADNLRDFLPLAAVRRCAAEAKARADLSRYSYSYFASDLEAVRLALGYSKLNLFAGSFGTRAAQVYLRAYPKSVRTMYLGSVVPLDVTIPLPLAGAFEGALDKTFATCAADDACHAAYPNLAADFREVMGRLGAGTTVQLPRTGKRVPLHAGRVAEWLRTRLYRAEGAAELPWLIHQAHGGNYAPIVDGLLEGARNRDSIGTAFSFGLFFSITCNDDIPFIDEAEVRRTSRGTTLGDYRVRQQQAACELWPRGKIPAGYRNPVLSEVPVMFVSGDSDPATPLQLTEHVAPNFPNRIEIILQGRGHTEWTGCVATLYEKFIRAGGKSGLAKDECSTPTRPPFRTN